jgi:hypothetical protein
MHYLEAIKKVGGRLKYRLHNTQKDPKDKMRRLLPKENQEALVWTSIEDPYM